MAEPVPLNEIPTLSLLYKLNRIETPDDAEPAYKPNVCFNDKLSVIRQDITTLEVGAIVNAANESLLGGGGVDGAIHRAAGPGLLDECETLDGCNTGSAKITEGYELPAEKVIHAVGPIYWKTQRGGSPAELLSGCYKTALELLVGETGPESKTIAFSALSTGIYGYPSEEASKVALETVRKFLEEGKADDVERIVFCNFMQKDEDAYFKNIYTFFPPTPEAQESEDEAEVAPPQDPQESAEEQELAAKLPDPPKTEPKDPDEPSAKKQKTEATAEDDFVVVDKEDAKDASKADL